MAINQWYNIPTLLSVLVIESKSLLFSNHVLIDNLSERVTKLRNLIYKRLVSFMRECQFRTYSAFSAATNLLKQLSWL